MKKHVINSAAQRINIPFPEMFFGNNYLLIEHEPSGLCLKLDPLDALALVDSSSDAGTKIRVSYADHWSAKRLSILVSASFFPIILIILLIDHNSQVDRDKVKDVIKPYDWTCEFFKLNVTRTDRIFF